MTQQPRTPSPQRRHETMAEWLSRLSYERGRADLLAQIEKAVLQAADGVRPSCGDCGAEIDVHTDCPEGDGYITFDGAAIFADSLAAIRSAAPVDHEHYWTDAPDDETGWFCTICRVTEYPKRPPFGAEP